MFKLTYINMSGKESKKKKKLIIIITDQWLNDEMCKLKTFKFNLGCCLLQKKLGYMEQN